MAQHFFEVDTVVATEASSTNLIWVSANNPVFVAGNCIKDGLFYLFFDSSKYGKTELKGFAVDVTLPVAADGADYEGRKIDHWSSYSNMPPEARLAYLNWLGTGQTRDDIHPAYVLNYLHGLELRLIQERSYEEARVILGKISELARRYRSHASIKKVILRLICAASILFFRKIPTSLDTMLAMNDDALPIKYAIGHAIATRQAIDPSAAILWVVRDPERFFQLPTGATLADLCEGFTAYIARSRSTGILLDDEGAPQLRYLYRASSGAFESDLTPHLDFVPDIEQSPLARRQLQVIVRDYCERYRRPFRHSSSNFLRDQVVTQHLPQSTSPLNLASAANEARESHGKDVVCDWAKSRLLEGGVISMRAGLKRLRGLSPKALSRSEIERLADVLAGAGIGLVPDPRFDLEPKRVTEEAVLFELEHSSDGFEPASIAYLRGLLLVMLCMSVARSDDDIAIEELELVERLVIELAGANEAYVRRLRAEIFWLQERPIPLGPILDAVSSLTEREKNELAMIVSRVAVVDGKLPANEWAFVRAIRIQLGQPDQDNALIELSKNGDLSRPAKTETSLFSDEVSATTEVYSDLNTVILSVPTEGQRDDWPSEGDSDLASLPPSFLPSVYDDLAALDLSGLDRKHASLLPAILQQTEWNRRALEQIARQHRLMLDGAIETLNEWAFDLFQDRLFEIDDNDVIRRNPDLVLISKRIAA